MATKQQVIALLKKQGAEWEFENADTFSAWLPDNLIWNSGYGCGVVTQEKDPDESWATFWQDILSIINADVVEKVGK